MHITLYGDDDDYSERVEVTGIGLNEDGSYYVFLDGELIPRYIGKKTWENGFEMAFEGEGYEGEIVIKTGLFS